MCLRMYDLSPARKQKTACLLPLICQGAAETSRGSGFSTVCLWSRPVEMEALCLEESWAHAASLIGQQEPY